jgi:hypothetical protein
MKGTSSSQIKGGGKVITRQLPVPLAYLLPCSAPGLQRPGKLLAELLFLLSEARNLIQVYKNTFLVRRTNYTAICSCSECATDLSSADTDRLNAE